MFTLEDRYGKTRNCAFTLTCSIWPVSSSRLHRFNLRQVFWYDSSTKPLHQTHVSHFSKTCVSPFVALKFYCDHARRVRFTDFASKGILGITGLLLFINFYIYFVTLVINFLPMVLSIQSVVSKALCRKRHSTPINFSIIFIFKVSSYASNLIITGNTRKTASFSPCFLTFFLCSDRVDFKLWYRNIALARALICVISKLNSCPVFLFLVILLFWSTSTSAGYWKTRNRLGNLLRELTWFREDPSTSLYLSRRISLHKLLLSPQDL